MNLKSMIKNQLNQNHQNQIILVRSHNNFKQKLVINSLIYLKNNFKIKINIANFVKDMIKGLSKKIIKICIIIMPVPCSVFVANVAKEQKLAPSLHTWLDSAKTASILRSVQDVKKPFIRKSLKLMLKKRNVCQPNLWLQLTAVLCATWT